jgi:hypothetical protein
MRVSKQGGAQGTKGCAMTALLAARQSSCTALAAVESLRIIDPVLYSITDGSVRKWPCVLPILCPSCPRRTAAKKGGFDWI